MATNISSEICFANNTIAAPIAARMSEYMKTDEDNMVLPKNDSQLKYILTSGHKASKMVGSSLKAHRSPFQSMIFLYGLSGAGKSSTLNHLFKSQLIPTSDRHSCTRDTKEYVATMDSPHWNVTGLDLGFVDTPGYGDTESEKKDVENIANIDVFLSNHPSLKSTLPPFKFYPNIVLIVSSITDNRMGGANSLFSKMMRMLANLNIVDKARPNVVIVLTFAMSIQPKSRHRVLVQEKINYVGNLARLFFEVNVPIVIMENMPEDLIKEGDWTILPNDSRQPLNLFEAMVSLMKISGDEIGIESIRLLFNNRKNIQIHEKRKMGSEKIFKASLQDISKWDKINESRMASLDESEIKNKITSCINEKRLNLLTLTNETVKPLLYRLQQVNLTNPLDLMNKNIEEVNRLLYPFKLNFQERILLFELFKVEPLHSLDDIDKLGCGYLASEQCIKFPIVSGNDLKYCYEIGTYIPMFSYFVSKGKLLIHCYFEWVKPSILSPRKPIIVFSIQYELFDLNIDLKTVAFKEVFSQAVNSLPKYELEPDRPIIKAYNSFFDNYGTQCITSLSYGGCITGSIDVSSSIDIVDEIKITEEVKNLLWIFFETTQNFNQVVLDYKSIINPNSHKLFDRLMKSSIKWIGGDEKFCASKLAKMEDINPAHWSKWVDSLNRKFVFLENVLHATKITTLLKRDDEKIAMLMGKVIDQHFPAELPSRDDKFIPVFENIEPHVWIALDAPPRSPITREEASESVKSPRLCNIT